MKNKKFIQYYCLILVMLFSTTVSAQNNETLESAVKNGISNGVVKREGYKIIFLASPAQDTTKIRDYYEGLIKKSGKPYQFSFQTNTIIQQPTDKISQNTNTNPIIGDKKIDRSVVPATTTGTPDTEQPASNCLTRQKVFGDIHYTDKTETYAFSVPAGVTTIKIEAWSGGGNGFAKTTYTERNAHEVHQQLLAGITGGGGGGGAYAVALIPVKKGDQIFITIPPGGAGKAVQVKLNSNENTFYLNNGSDGDEDALNGKGYGGNSGGTYGIFKNTLYWIAGENGTNTTLTSYVYHDAPNGDGLLLPAGLVIQDYNIDYGKGGAAASLNNGGKGAALFTNGIYQRHESTNGGFPGGGGGGGNIEHSAFKPGKGAPGLVIIHY